MLSVFVVLLFIPTNNMCPPTQKQSGFDALDREIKQQWYLDEEFDSCDYVEMNNLIATEKGDLAMIQ